MYPGEKMTFLVQLQGDTVTNYDGPHDDVEGVARALKLLRGIFGNDESEQNVMLTVEPVPVLDPPVNEEAVGLCRKAVKRYRCGS
jgi:hypothetical protein